MNIEHQNTIAKYLTNRVMNNANWYRNTGSIDDFKLSVSDETVFHFIYFIINHRLNEGHTILTLKNTSQMNGRLNSWQSLLLMPVMDMITDKIGNVLDFEQIFYRIHELQHDTQSLNDYIDEQKHHLTTLFYKQQMLNVKPYHANEQEMRQVVTQLIELFISVLRLYYFTSIHLNQDFYQFVKRFDDHPFFVRNDDKRLNGVMVFYHEHDSLYLWLHRSYQAERALLSAIYRICQSPVARIDLPTLNTSLNQEQKHAIQRVATASFSIITGGPGTGKTFTVAQIVLALHHAVRHHWDGANKELSLALVAPTGKASQRMAESLQHALKDNTDIALPEPMTIHRLLGIGMNGMPYYRESRPLPYEMIIVDEASMLGTELARHLLCAVKEGARIILLGDVHQLSAVEAGAVLADLCCIRSLSSVRTHLIESNRFSSTSGIGQLAALINQSHDIRFTQLMALIHENDHLSFTDTTHLSHQLSLQAFYQNIAHDYMKPNGFFEQTKALRFKFHQYHEDKKQEIVKKLNAGFNQYRILTASHLGRFGDDMVNDFIEKLHRDYLKLNSTKSPWYHGRPVMILKNRYDLGLFNGDIGICLQNGKNPHELSVYFGESMKGLPVSMLDGDIVSTAYAMTVHKSQGSEFDKVAVVFGDENERLLSKELVYTAITRAKVQVAIYTTEQALSKAVNTPTIRQTGLLIHDMFAEH